MIADFTKWVNSGEEEEDIDDEEVLMQETAQTKDCTSAVILLDQMGLCKFYYFPC